MSHGRIIIKIMVTTLVLWSSSSRDIKKCCVILTPVGRYQKLRPKYWSMVFHVIELKGQPKPMNNKYRGGRGRQVKPKILNSEESKWRTDRAMVTYNLTRGANQHPVTVAAGLQGLQQLINAQFARSLISSATSTHHGHLRNIYYGLLRHRQTLLQRCSYHRRKDLDHRVPGSC